MAKTDEEFYLYFIIRSTVMGLVGAVLFSVTVWAFRLTDLVQILVISVVNFFLVLFISRLFDSQIKYTVRRILRILKRYPRLKGFVLKNF